MRRRDFIKVIFGSATVLPLAASAEQPTGKLSTIGFLGAGSSSGQGSWVSALVQRLRELGWNEGSIAFETRWADTRDDRLSEMAAEFVRLKVDVIVAVGTQAAVAAKRATSTIPIVFPASGDPVGAGLVGSLAQPGGNATGLSLENIDLTSKRVALLREVVPGVRRLAIMANVDSLVGRLDMKEAGQRPANSVLKLSRSKSVTLRILRRASPISVTEPMHSTLPVIRSW